MNEQDVVFKSDKLSVSSNDTTTDYLINKLVPATQAGIIVEEQSDGGNETLSLRIGTHFKQQLSTGVIDGGLLSIGTPTTTFSISDGEGIIVDLIDPLVPDITPLSWSGLTNISVTDIGSQLITFIGINSSGVVLQQGTPFTHAQHRQIAVLGVIVHVDNLTVNATNNEQFTVANPANQFHDLAKAIGLFNVVGNVFGTSGADMTFDKSVGDVFAIGSNWANNQLNPNQLTLLAELDIAFQYRFQDGSNRLPSATGELVIDPDSWDDGGVESAVSNNRWTIQRIYLFLSGAVKIQMGQVEYSNLGSAREGIKNDTFLTEPSIEDNGLLRGFLIVKKGCSDLTDTGEAEFVSAERFGSSTGAGGVSVSSLQNAYENSTDPEITTNALLGALSLNQGSGLDTDDVLEVRNGIGTQTFAITGNGDVGVGGDLNHDGTNIGFFATTPVIQAGQIIQLTDNSGGTPSNTISAITDVTTRDAIASLVAKINALEDVIGGTNGVGLSV